MRKVSGKGEPDDDGADMACVTPTSFLVELASNQLGQDSTMQMDNTRRLLGMSVHRSRKGDDCTGVAERLHDGGWSGETEVTVTRLGVTPGLTGTVQDCLTKIENMQPPKKRAGVEGILNGGQPRQVTKDEDVVLERCFEEETSDMFFAGVGDSGLEREDFSLSAGVEHSHVVKWFGDEYCLCGVTYRLRSGQLIRYSSQIYLEEGWWTLGDTRGGGLDFNPNGEFDADFCRGSEDILMYVRTDIVQMAHGAGVIEREPESNPDNANKVSVGGIRHRRSRRGIPAHFVARPCTNTMEALRHTRLQPLCINQTLTQSVQ